MSFVVNIMIELLSVAPVLHVFIGHFSHILAENVLRQP